MPIFSSDFKISDKKPLNEISDITYQFLPESARGTHGTNSEPSGIQSVDGKTLGISLSDKPSMTKFNSGYLNGPIKVLHPDMYPNDSLGYSMLVWFKTHTYYQMGGDMIVKFGASHFVSHTSATLDFTANSDTTNVSGVTFDLVNGDWHCLIMSLDTGGISYLFDESKNGSGILAGGSITNFGASSVEFGALGTHVGMVIRMPNTLTLDQMYTLKRSTQDRFIGMHSVSPFAFSSGSLIINGTLAPPPFPAHTLRFYVANSTLVIENPYNYSWQFTGSSISNPYLETLDSTYHPQPKTDHFQVVRANNNLWTADTGGGFLYTGYIPPASVMKTTGSFTWAVLAKFAVTNSTDQATGSRYTREFADLMGNGTMSTQWHQTTFPNPHTNTFAQMIVSDAGLLGINVMRSPQQLASTYTTHDVNQDNDYHWYAFVKSGSNYNLYVDGVQKGITYTFDYDLDWDTASNVAPDNMVRVGGGYFDKISMDMDVKEARIWESALTATELLVMVV